MIGRKVAFEFGTHAFFVMRVDVGEQSSLFGWCPGYGLIHAEWIENAFLQKVRQLHAGPFFDQVALDVDTDAVVPLSAWLEQQGNAGELFDELRKLLVVIKNVQFTVQLVDAGIAEDAVSEATPIFINAVKGITFNDAKTILLGNDNAATQYLTNATKTALYDKFNPVIKNSFEKVGATKIWKNLITKYNNIPLTKNVNPDLTDYVTQEALNGVYTMIAVEEKEIRTKVSSRTTDLLIFYR